MLAVIDTVSLRISMALPDRVASALDQAEERTDMDTGDMAIVGKLRNFRVTARGANVRLVGSLHKFVNPDGTNLTPVTDDDQARGIEELSDALGVDVAAAHVSRIDIGANMTMPRPVAEYLRVFGSADRATTRAYLGQSLAFTTAQHAVVLYDKLREMRANGAARSISDEYRGANIVRYELQLRRRVDYQLGRDVTAGLIGDPDFARDLRGRWLDHFDRAPVRQMFTLTGNVDVTTLRDHLALVGVEARGGTEEVESMLVEARASGLVQDRQFFRHRAWLRALPEKARLDVESSALAELRETVCRAAALSEMSPSHAGG